MEDAVGMVEEKELDSSVELASARLSGDVDAMLLNEAFLDTLEEIRRPDKTFRIR